MMTSLQMIPEVEAIRANHPQDKLFFCARGLVLQRAKRGLASKGCARESLRRLGPRLVPVSQWNSAWPLTREPSWVVMTQPGVFVMLPPEQEWQTVAQWTQVPKLNRVKRPLPLQGKHLPVTMPTRQIDSFGIWTCPNEYRMGKKFL
jgi:hypothetical protein